MAELADTLTPSEADRLEQAEALVRSYCRWHIAPERTETVTLQPSFSKTLILPSLRVASVASVTEDGEAVDADDYEFDARGWLFRTWGTWSTGPISLSLTHGHQIVPADVTAVVQAIAQRAVDNPGSLIRTQSGPFSDTYSQTGTNQSLPIALLDAEKDILAAHALPRLA